MEHDILLEVHGLLSDDPFDNIKRVRPLQQNI